MANPKDTKMVRDMLGGVVPQTLNDDGTYRVLANGDVSNVDFSRKKLLRDHLGGVLPQQYYDVEKGRFVPGALGGGGDVSQEDLLNLSNEVNGKVEQVTTQLAQSKEDLLGRGANPVILSGADNTGVNDASQAIANAFVLNKQVVLPPGIYLISNLIIPDGCTLVGSGKTLTILKKSANGYMIDLGRQSKIFDCGFEGVKETYTGAGVVISKGENTITRGNQGHQRIVRCSFDNMEGYHVEYTQPNKGWMSRAVECDFGATNADASIKWPDENTNGGNRYVYDCYSSKAIVNVGGCDNGVISFNTVGGIGADEDGIIFPTGTTNVSKKVIITGNRLAIANGTLKVRGIDHTINDNIVAGNAHLTTDAIGCRWGVGNKLSGNFINAHRSNEIFGVSGSYIPEWTASTTAPSYGNASVQAFWRWEGKKISVSIQITFGSTTTFGSGAWNFSLPIILDGMSIKRFSGTALTSKGNTGILLGTPGSGKITIYRTGDTVSVFNSSSPHTWASGDYLLMDFEYSLLS